MRWSVVFAVLLFVPSGCLSGEETHGQMDAMDGVLRAEALVSEVAGPVDLVGVAGIEASDPDLLTEDDGPFEQLGLEADPRIGDGLALAWSYVFQEADAGGHEGAMWQVVIRADGSHVAPERTSDGGDEVGLPYARGPLDGWEVSSARAAEIAAGNHDAWKDPETGWDGIWLLMPNEDRTGPVWVVGFEEAGGGSDIAWVSVDASSGEYLGFE